MFWARVSRDVLVWWLKRTICRSLWWTDGSKMSGSPLGTEVVGWRFNVAYCWCILKALIYILSSESRIIYVFM